MFSSCGADEALNLLYYVKIINKNRRTSNSGISSVHQGGLKNYHSV